MNKVKKIICIIVVSILTVSNIPVQALSTNLDDKFYNYFSNSIIFKVGSSKVIRNLFETRMDSSNPNVKLFIKNGVLYLPVSFLTRCLNGIVEWDDINNCATIQQDSMIIKIKNGDKNVYVDNELIPFTSSIENLQEKLYVPAVEYTEKVLNKEIFINNGIVIIGDRDAIWRNKIDNNLLNYILQRFNDLENEMFIIDQNGKQGYINKTGKVVISPQYKKVKGFSEGFAPVYDVNGMWIIDKKGNKLTQNKYFRVDYFSNGLAAASLYKNGSFKDGFLDRSGKFKIITDQGYSNYSDGLVVVCERDNNSMKFGYMDKEGKIAIDFKFDYAFDFYNGIAVVISDGKVGYINKKGDYIIKPQFGKMKNYGYSFFREGIAVANVGDSDNKKFVYIDQKGEIISQEYYDDAYPMSDGLAPVVKIQNGKNKYGYIDRYGQSVIPIQYDDAWGFVDGVALVKLGSKYNFIDKKGNLISELYFDYAFSFSEGLGCVYIEDKGFGYINKKGNFVIGPKYTDGSTFVNGLAYVCDEKLEGYINKQGKYIWSKKCEEGKDYTVIQ